MKIYTRGGDAGQTGLFGGHRLPKNDPQVEAYGAVDEANAALGLARSLQLAEPLAAVLSQWQHALFVVGAELSTPPSHRDRLKLRLIGDSEVQGLERWIDEQEALLPPLTAFILPGGCPAAAALHQGRTACRRAERFMVGVADSIELRPELLRYINRLSDALFVMARRANQEAGVADELWMPPQA